MSRILVSIVCMLLLACSAQEQVASKKSVNTETEICDSWSLAKGEFQDGPLVIRFRDCRSGCCNKPMYPKLIQVVWEFEHNGSGMPLLHISHEMEVFENRLVSALEGSGKGVLVAVVTTGGSREWVYYSENALTFSDAITNMPQEVEPYPVKLEASDDPRWEYLKNEILSGMQQS